jgi:hypothetical protein
MTGPRAVPGTYQVRLTTTDWTSERSFELKKDPRLTEISQEDLVSQRDFLIQVRERFNAMHRALQTIRSLREQLGEITTRLENEDIEAAANTIEDKLTSIENELIQTKPGGWSQKPKIRSHLAWVASAASSQRGEYTDARPTDQLEERFRDLKVQLDGELERLRGVLDEDLAAFNGMLRDKNVSAIFITP